MNKSLELTGDKQRGKYIKEGLANGTEIVADLIPLLAEAPFLGSFLKFGKLAINTYDYIYVKKIGIFLDASEYTEQEFDTFCERMNSHEQEVLSEFLINSISQADHRDKVTILGYIYKYRVKNKIDDDMLFRLCSAINRCYAGDLKELLRHENSKVGASYKVDILFNAGLLKSKGYNGGNTTTLPGAFGMIYQLNEIGEKLVDILKKENWFDDKK